MGSQKRAGDSCLVQLGELMLSRTFFALNVITIPYPSCFLIPFFALSPAGSKAACNAANGKAESSSSSSSSSSEDSDKEKAASAKVNSETSMDDSIGVREV